MEEFNWYFLFYFSDLGKAYKSFAQRLKDFKFECIGEKLTDDEARIGKIHLWDMEVDFHC